MIGSCPKSEVARKFDLFVICLTDTDRLLVGLQNETFVAGFHKLMCGIRILFG